MADEATDSAFVRAEYPPKPKHPDRFEEGRQAGRAEVLALVAKLPSPLCQADSIIGRIEYCQWCGTRFETVGAPHPANGCLFVLAQETGKEQA